jgi:hypothetical protein
MVEHKGWSNNEPFEQSMQRYREAAEAAMHSTRCTECTEDEYWDKLEILPPIMVPGGFLVMEAFTDSPMGPVHSMYARINGRFYSKYVVKGRPETYIHASEIGDAYPINPVMAEIARRQREDA